MVELLIQICQCEDQGQVIYSNMLMLGSRSGFSLAHFENRLIVHCL